MSTKKNIKSIKSIKISKKKISNSLTLKQKLNNSKYKYYLIHANTSITMLVLVNTKNNSLTVHKTIYGYEFLNKSLKTRQSFIEFNDYTLGNSIIDEEDELFLLPKPIFQIRKYEKIFIGHDIFPMNTYIKNKKFGLGNSIIVYDGKDYYSIYYNKVTKLNRKQIKGKVSGYVSPIGNNDVPYPMMFTDTHIYSWCDDIDEYEIPDIKSQKLIQILIKFKNPFDVPKNKVKEVNDFFKKYQCQNNKIKLKEKVLLKVNY
jgi:hypothetical protein